MTKILCGNADGHQPRPAVARVSWPGGRFSPSTACASCLQILLRGVRDGEPDEDYPILVSPLKPPAVTGYSIRAAVTGALTAMEGASMQDTAEVVLKALGMESTDA